MKTAEEIKSKKALEIINTSKTQAEAFARLKATFDGDMKFNIKHWFAYNNLPKQQENGK